ncbi:MAG: 2-C-methyl-D-erythritol 4-phosphate cytidylyltransferase [Ruminococcaceae bacterium]|nr:2-C-methyl-D-erythritol 4-phosphate cytidylyltransferase [Oscillospiraceae bacterium]
MKTTALILAGGCGSRSAQAVPKQFLTVDDIPVIVYTMKNIQAVEQIDSIVVAGPQGWENFIYTYAKQFGISKLDMVVVGGSTRHESICNGIKYIADAGGTERVCLFDANRPLIPKQMIVDTIELSEKCDCALLVEPSYDSMFISHDENSLETYTDRSCLYRGEMPECARLEALVDIYKRAEKEGLTELTTTSLFLHFGKKVLTTRGNIRCFKITTADDFELFRALLKVEKMENLMK